MISDPWFYAAAVPAMLILGLSKGGFSTIGMLTVPILSLAISPVQAAAIVLPILVLSDVVAVVSYRGSFDAMTLKIMLPGAVVGIGIGWWTAAWVTDHEIRLIVGAISVAFALNYWFRHRRRLTPHGHNAITGSFWGAVAGFTSFVSHAGGPPFQMYVVPLRLDPRIFAGTSVIAFAAINAVKLVPYFFLGQFAVGNLTTSAALLPVSIPATLLGIRLVRRFEAQSFYNLIYVAIFLVGAFLVWEGLTAGA
ncbi:sulfite exporter TauE/SafE family protein [soil metagenome]